MDPTLTIVAALGAGLIGGVLFIFSVCIMAALAELPAPMGIRAMQSINRTILNPAFLISFLGTGLLSIGVIVTATDTRGNDTVFRIGGGILYLVAVLITMSINVPLNNRLDAADADSETGAQTWRSYLRSWTRWNHARTAAALAGSLGMILSL